MFVDGVYLGINGGVVFDIFDVESVEILRGPQGVLFGRNVTGGAVLINTTSPTNPPNPPDQPNQPNPPDQPTRPNPKKI